MTSSLNLDNIETVQDLITQNELVEEQPDELSFEERVVQEVLSNDKGWAAGHTIITRLLDAELRLHQHWLNNFLEGQKLEGDQVPNMALLVRDIIKLQTAQAALAEVELEATDEEAEA